MTTLTGSHDRTLTGYLVTLLEYPRWRIEHEIDFTDCHLQGEFEAGDAVCATCEFGAACNWLSRRQPTLDTPLAELEIALRSALRFVAERRDPRLPHEQGCDCEACQWLREARGFLRTRRQRG